MSDPEASRRLFRNALREALIVVAVWALTLLWTIGVCYLYGFEHDEDSLVVRLGLVARTGPERPQQPRELTLIAGFPDWVFLGILVPWLLCSCFTVWFAFYGMTDDDLGVEAQEEHGHGH